MNWNESYTATWRVFRVNRRTWADGSTLPKVDSVNVSRTANGSLLESGSMTVSNEFESDYYRIVMTAEQDGELTRVDVATLLFDVAGGDVDYGTTEHDVDGFSVLYPASVTAVTVGEYAPAGVDGAQYVKELLESCINAPVVVEGSFYLNDHVVHELGSTVLNAAWNVLDAGDFVMQIDGRGVVHIMPKPTEPSLIVSNATAGLMQNGISYTANMSDIPNRYVVIDDIMITIAENNDPESIISTVSRGYNVDIIDTSPTPVNNETYGEYANRMLKNLSVLKDERTYVREFAPDVYPYSIIRATINGLDGDFRVNSQTINCNNGITVNEKSVKETQLWMG